MKTAIAIHRLCEKPEWMTQCQTWDETEWPRTPEITEFFADHYRDAANIIMATSCRKPLSL